MVIERWRKVESLFHAALEEVSRLLNSTRAPFWLLAPDSLLLAPDFWLRLCCSAGQADSLPPIHRRTVSALVSGKRPVETGQQDESCPT